MVWIIPDAMIEVQLSIETLFFLPKLDSTTQQILLAVSHSVWIPLPLGIIIYSSVTVTLCLRKQVLKMEEELELQSTIEETESSDNSVVEINNTKYGEAVDDIIDDPPDSQMQARKHTGNYSRLLMGKRLKDTRNVLVICSTSAIAQCPGLVLAAVYSATGIANSWLIFMTTLILLIKCSVNAILHLKFYSYLRYEKFRRKYE